MLRVQAERVLSSVMRDTFPHHAGAFNHGGFLNQS